jgi:hypothetical protein
MAKDAKPKRGPGWPRKQYISSSRHAAKMSQLRPPTPDDPPPPSPTPPPSLKPLNHPTTGLSESWAPPPLTVDEKRMAQLATQRPGALRFLGRPASSLDVGPLFLDAVRRDEDDSRDLGAVQTTELPYLF